MRIGVIQNSWNLSKNRLGIIDYNSRPADFQPSFNGKFSGVDTFVKKTKVFEHLGVDKKEFKKTLFYMAKDLRKIDNFPCGYSGIPMISRVSFSKIFTEAGLNYSINSSLGRLNPFANNLYPTEQAVLKKINTVKKFAGVKNLKTALDILAPESAQRLVAKQQKTFEEIFDMTSKMGPVDKKEIREILGKTQEVIEKHAPPPDTVRRILIDHLKAIKGDVYDRESYQKIYKKAEKLACSINDEDAFIIQYKQKKSEYLERRLVLPSVSSFDHIIPVNRGGEEFPENAIIVSNERNSDKTNIPFADWIQDKKEKVEQSMQKQVDFIIKESNRGKIKDMAWYVVALKNTISKLSNGEIQLNISKLQPNKRELSLIKRIAQECPEVFGNFLENAA